MRVRSFTTGGLIHKVNIEISLNELQDLINEGKWAIEQCESPDHVKRLGTLVSELCEYYETIKT